MMTALVALLIGVGGGALFYWGISDMTIGQSCFAAVLVLAWVAMFMEALRSQRP